MTKNPEYEDNIKIQIAGYLEFVATVQVINEEFNRIVTKSRLNGDANTFVQTAIARKNAIASALEKLLSIFGTESPKEIDAVLREAGYDPDDLAAQIKAAAEQALASSPFGGRKD